MAYRSFCRGLRRGGQPIMAAAAFRGGSAVDHRNGYCYPLWQPKQEDLRISCTSRWKSMRERVICAASAPNKQSAHRVYNPCVCRALSRFGSAGAAGEGSVESQGRWIAYVSTESGAAEVFVQP